MCNTSPTASRSLPRLLSEKGYAATAYHNFTRRFWLRDQIYPKLGFERFVSMEEMTLVIQPNDWPTDEGLYQSVLETVGGDKPQFHFIVTVRDPRALCEGRGGCRRPQWRPRLPHAALTMPRSPSPPSSSELDAQGQALRARAVRRSPAGPAPAPVEERHEVRDRPAPAPGAGARSPATRRTCPRFADAIANRPLYCLPPLLLDWIGQPTADRYMNYAARSAASPPRRCWRRRKP